MVDEMWCSVDVYGPQSEIDRFKRLVIAPNLSEHGGERWLMLDLSRVDAPPPGSNDAAPPVTSRKLADSVWNFRENKEQERGSYWFAFDTVTIFPISTLKRLASLFPRLAFDCDCIADNDSSMGYGWFNPPPGGEQFWDGYDVPQGYWDEGGTKRDPLAEMRHIRRVEIVKRAAREADD